MDTPYVALAIGNDAYKHVAALDNATNDARAVSGALRDVNFAVDTVVNVDLAQMNAAIDAFIGRLKPGSVGLFYYAGHGVQLAGENFLIPVDFNETSDEKRAKTLSISASSIREQMERTGARINLLIFDACRNNPFRTRSMFPSLAGMSYGEGTFIALATGPQSKASDGSGAKNGLFTGFLVEMLKQPELTLDQLFAQVRKQVVAASNKRQVPWSESGVVGDFYFRPPRGWQLPRLDTETPLASAPAMNPPLLEVRPEAEKAAAEAFRIGENAIGRAELPRGVAELRRAVDLNPSRAD